jgi:hypothetical protein
MLDWRNNDGTLAVATHGRGVFTTTGTWPLPVELSSFTAKVLRNGGVQLNWRTETEANNFGFEVERKISSKQSTAGNWEKIGFVEGHGTTNSPKNYSFTDKGISYGVYSYRLKQIDSDGTYKYSKEIEIDVSEIPNYFILAQNYPNPFSARGGSAFGGNPSTTIKYVLPKNERVKIEVFNAIGQRVAKLLDKQVSSGNHEIQFDAQDLPSGLYTYRITAGQFQAVKKMLLLK